MAQGSAKRRWMQILAAAGLAALTVVAVVVVSRDDGGDANRVRVFDDLSNVENSVFALGSVWAVTSNLDDNYSGGEADASLILMDPATGESETLLDGLSAQPTLASLNDRVWAKLDDRVVAFDASGVEVQSLPWEVAGEMFAGEEYVWITDFKGAQVSVIDPATARVVRTLDSDRFPIQPIFAFGHAWLPSSTDGTVTVVDEATLGETTRLSIAVSNEQLSEITAVPGGATGDEVWVANLQGELFAIGAQAETFGELRDIPVDRAINRLVPQGDRIVLLPTGGLSVLVADLATGETLAEISLDSIPFRAIADGDSDGDGMWIASDGPLEALTHINLRELTLVEQFQIGTNTSTTTGPTQPFVVDNEIWVPNRGDNAIFAVTTS